MSVPFEDPLPLLIAAIKRCGVVLSEHDQADALLKTLVDEGVKNSEVAANSHRAKQVRFNGSSTVS